MLWMWPVTAFRACIEQEREDEKEDQDEIVESLTRHECKSLRCARIKQKCLDRSVHHAPIPDKPLLSFSARPAYLPAFFPGVL